VQRERLESRAIISAGYDEATCELTLEYRSGHVYRYEGVPASLYAWLLRTKNKGGFVRRMIAGRYGEQAVIAEPPPGAPPAPSLEEALLASLARLSKPAG
jgi:KTSC domain-containing protein